MNADDVVFSFARVFDQKHPYHDVNGGEYYFDSPVRRFGAEREKLDDYTVEIRLQSPDASFLWHRPHYAPVLSAEYAALLTREGHRADRPRRSAAAVPAQANTARGNIFARAQRRLLKGCRMPQVVIDLGAGGAGRLSNC